MVRNIVVFGGSSHPSFSQFVCDQLGIPAGSCLLSKFSVGETRVEIKESVRNKDVYVLQTGAGAVNDNLLEMLITISACKTASARKVTAVMPFFPYSRSGDVPSKRPAAALARAPSSLESDAQEDQSPSHPQTNCVDAVQHGVSKIKLMDPAPSISPSKQAQNDQDTSDQDLYNKQDSFQPRPGYRQWVAQSGTLVADLLTCAGADHIITMDLHDPQYQGFFDIPVDNLHSRPILKRYIQQNIPNYRQAVCVSPDAGGAKRATAIADALGMPFALIHNEQRPTHDSKERKTTMLLVGEVAERTAILIDDLVDTSETITRAAKLLKKEGASKVYALITHAILSGDAIARINASALDKLIVTNSVPQEAHEQNCSKIEILDVGHVFAEAIRRVHHGESISVLFQHD